MSPASATKLARVRGVDAAFFGAAVALHLAAALVAGELPRGEPQFVATGRSDADDVVAIDFTESPASPRAEHSDLSRSAESIAVGADNSPPHPARARDVGSGRATGGGAGAPGETVPGGSEARSAPPPVESADEYGPTPPHDVPGLGGRPVYVLPGVLPDRAAAPPAPTRAPSAPPVDRNAAGKVVSDVLQEKDKALGLDLPAAGTVASAVRDAVRSANTPGVSRATFEVRLGPDGRVLGVRVVRSTAGQASEWAKAAQLVAARFATAGLLQMGAFSAGAVILVDVASDLELPAGQAGGVQGSGARFDLSNIGAHASRVIRTSFRVIPIR